MSKSRKPTTKIAAGQTEISIVRFPGLEVRSFVKKMNRRQAQLMVESKKIAPGTQFTVEHAVVGAGNEMFGPVLRSLGTVECIAHAHDAIPADYSEG